MRNRWIGVDLDGTLAQFEKWKGFYDIGEPIPEMVDKVVKAIREGHDIRIFTARITGQRHDVCEYMSPFLVKEIIEKWCWKHIGHILPITNEKDFDCREIWGDECVAIERNTGRVLGGPGHGKPHTM